MTALIPNSQVNGVETYEDMFKEITRKLYGEETSHGLHTLGTPVAHIASGTNTNIPDGERSFTTLLSERNANSIDYEQNAGNDGNNILKNDDHLTAFGLALMQNGFQSHNSILNSHTFHQINKQQQQQQPQQNNQQQSQQQQQQPQQQHEQQHNSLNGLNQSGPVSNANMNTMAHNASVAAADNMHEKWANSQHQTAEMNDWNANKQNYQHIQKHFKAKKSEIPGIAPMPNQTSNVIANHETMKQMGASKVNNAPAAQFQKRYGCNSCPYSTDRRDLFTRHENIHKEDKPFHCYVCLKVFNRADHVKKHFLRMHRSLTYDIGRTRRSTAGSRQQSQSQSQSKKMPTTTTTTTPSTASYFNQMAGQTNDSITTLNIPSACQNLQQIDGSQTMLDPNHNNGPRSNNSQTMQQQQHRIQTTDIPSTSQQQQHNAVKMEKCSSSSSSGGGGDKNDKKKNDKRFMCCYCSWSGNDNWGLKRHLNTHTKPFVCILCDYKAARSERLATHVSKVHNKKVCTKCNYLADNQTEYDTHVFEVHAHDARTQRNHTTNNLADSKINSNILRSVNNAYANNSNMSTGHGVSSIQGTWRSSGVGNDGSTSMTSGQNVSKAIDSSQQKRGAERLFQYLEADDSDPEDYSRQLQMAALSRNTASVAQDFHNAGGGDKKDSIKNSPTKNNSNDNANAFRFSKNSLECGIAIDSNMETKAIQWKLSPPALRPNHDQHRQQSSSSELSEKENYMLTSDNPSESDGVQPNVKNKNSFDDYLRVTIPAACISPRKRIAGDAKLCASNKLNGKYSKRCAVERRLTAMQRIEILRDKYLLQMISRKLSCRCCDEKKPFMVIPYHNYLSLMLHKIWRHPNRRYHCRMCSITFKYKYQQILHNRQHCRHRNRKF